VPTWGTFSRTVLNAPFDSPHDASGDSIEVTDPAHPLFGRILRLLSVTRGDGESSSVLVRYRDGIALSIPRCSTSLSVLARHTPHSKLCTVAVQEFLGLVKEYESCPCPPKKSGRHLERRSSEKSSKN